MIPGAVSSPLIQGWEWEGAEQGGRETETILVIPGPVSSPLIQGRGQEGPVSSV